MESNSIDLTIPIALFLVIVFASVITWNQELKGKKKGQSKRNTHILFSLSIFGAVITLAASIKSEVSESNHEALLRKTIYLQDSVVNHITGGDSYLSAYVLGNYTMYKLPHANVSIMVNGSYPLHRIQVRIVDENNLEVPTLDSKNKNTFQLGTLAGGYSVDISEYPIVLDTIRGVNLNFFFDASNGAGTHILKMRYTNGRWRTASRTYHKRGIVEQIDKEYPTQEPKVIFGN